MQLRLHTSVWLTEGLVTCNKCFILFVDNFPSLKGFHPRVQFINFLKVYEVYESLESGLLFRIHEISRISNYTKHIAILAMQLWRQKAALIHWHSCDQHFYHTHTAVATTCCDERYVIFSVINSNQNDGWRSVWLAVGSPISLLV